MMRIHNEALRDQLVQHSPKSKPSKTQIDGLSSVRTSQAEMPIIEDDPFRTQSILSTDLIDKRFHGVYYFPDMVDHPRKPGLHLMQSQNGQNNLSGSKLNKAYGPGIQAMEHMVQQEEGKCIRFIRS